MTSISEKVAALLREATSPEAGLAAAAAFLERERRTRVSFCRLFGRRWSHVAGSPGAVLPEARIELAPGWGAIVENDALTDVEWQEIGALLPESNRPR